MTPVALYGAAAWAPTSTLEHDLEKTRRCMLRKMLMLPRDQSEDWVEYVRRSTNIAEAAAERHGFSNLTTRARLRKWVFAGKTLRHTDARWSTRLIRWVPWFRFDGNRDQGRPVTRWCDKFVSYAGGGWKEMALDGNVWMEFAPGFGSM